MNNKLSNQRKSKLTSIRCAIVEAQDSFFFYALVQL